MLLDLLCDSDEAAAYVPSALADARPGPRCAPTALLPHCHPLRPGQLDHVHAEDVHEVAVRLVEDIAEQARMRPKH